MIVCTHHPTTLHDQEIVDTLPPAVYPPPYMVEVIYFCL
jgi:hypothetical protein